jgi:hypothetical protein
MILPLVRPMPSSHSAQYMSFITPLLIGGHLVEWVVLACLLPGARSRWGYRSRQLMVDAGGFWGQVDSRLGMVDVARGALTLSPTTGNGLGEAAMA